MLLRVLNCIPKDLACPSDTLLISMGIHPQSDSFVGVAQLFRYTGNVRAVGDGFLALLKPKLTQQRNDLWVYINGAVSSILWGIQIDTLVRGITEIAADGNGVLCKVHILPLQAAALTPADACVNQ